MKRLGLVLFIAVALLSGISGSAIGYDDAGYPYAVFSGCQQTCEPADAYGFCRNNCTSYVAYMLNNKMGVNFRNGYGGVHWSDALNWTNAAAQVGIPIDNNPLPGAVAWWDYGHVAIVERVRFDGHSVESIDYTQFNINPCHYSEETEVEPGDADYPDAFIHIAMFDHGLMFYLDSLEMSLAAGRPFSNQTSEEISKIIYQILPLYSNVQITVEDHIQFIAFLDEIGVGYGGTAGDSGESDGPDMNVKLTELAKNSSDNFHHTLTIRPGRLFQIKTHFTNKGDEDGEFDGVYYASVDKDFNKDQDYKFGVDHDLELDAGDLLSEGKRDLFMNNEGKWYVWSRAKCEDDVDTSNDYSRNDDKEEYAVLIVVKPNFYFTNVDFDLGSDGLDPGQNTSVTVTVYNGGSEPEQDVKVRYYISEGDVYDNPTYLGQVNIPGIHIEEKESYIASFNFQVPVEPGVYTLSIHADGLEVVTEGNEVDNWHHITFEVKRPYTFSFAQTAEDVQDMGDYFYEAVNPKSTFNFGEAVYYLAKLEDVTAPHRLKLDIQHSEGWGWDEVWGWEDPGAGWEYTFFTTYIADPDPGVYTLTFSITTDDVNWTQLSQIQATVLDNSPPYQYAGTQTCEDLIYHGDPLWEYEMVSQTSTFQVEDDIYVLTEINNVSVDHRFRIEVYYEDEFWWADGDESTPFFDVNETWSHSYGWVAQYAEFTGAFSFKIYLDIGNGYEFLEEVSTTVVP